MSSGAVVRDAREWRESLALYYPRVRNWFAHVLADPAAVDDLTQEVFVRLCNRLSSGEPVLAPWNYIKVVARNVFMEHLRAQKKRKAFFLLGEEAVTDPSSQPGEIYAQAEASEAIPLLLVHLPVDQRQILVGRYFLDLTVRELAEAMGTAASTIVERHNRALCQLRRLALNQGIAL